MDNGQLKNLKRKETIKDFTTRHKGTELFTCLTEIFQKSHLITIRNSHFLSVSLSSCNIATPHLIQSNIRLQGEQIQSSGNNDTLL